MARLTIGALAKATNTKVETIRWYEREGIMPVPSRTAGNYRSYDERQRQRLGFVRRCRDLGFSLDEVKELLAFVDQPGRDCGAVERIASVHLAAVRRKIADLRSLAKELERINSNCRGGAIADCRILEALIPKSSE
jgi:DNA-binding transcriptional MerR regulator